MKSLNAKLSFPELKGAEIIAFWGKAYFVLSVYWRTITVEQPPLGLRELLKTEPPKCEQQVDLRQKLQIFEWKKLPFLRTSRYYGFIGTFSATAS